MNKDGSDEVKIGDYNPKTNKVVMNGNAPGSSLFNYGGFLSDKNNNRFLANIVKKQINTDANFVEGELKNVVNPNHKDHNEFLEIVERMKDLPFFVIAKNNDSPPS